MTSRTVKITEKGQVTIPKEVRERLKSRTVYFEIQGDAVTIKPVPDVGGSLHRYAKNVKRGTSIHQLREQAWGEVVREKAAKKSS